MTHHPSADVQSPRTASDAPAAGPGQPSHAPRPPQAGQAAKNRRGPQVSPQAKQPKQTGQAKQQACTRKHKSRRTPAATRESASRPPRRVRIGSPAALLAVVPALLGFEPSESIVVVGTELPRAEVRVTLRYNLPNPPDPRLSAEIVRHAVGVLAAQRIDRAVAVGYGPDDLVSPIADALRAYAPQAGIAVTELLRAENQRYWSYVCTEPSCCPPDGTPFDIEDHPAAQAMATEGARVLASRDELVASLAAADGETGAAMDKATRKAEEQLARLISRVSRSRRKGAARRLIATAGLQAVANALRAYRAGDDISPERAAWLTVVLCDLRVRDDAWSRMDPEQAAAHLHLWTDMTRMARPGYVAAPASLLAFVAWQSGNGALANVALDRALADVPGYSMAVLLRQAIDSGAPPSLARLPMTPDEVAASYDEAEAEADEAEAEAEADNPGVLDEGETAPGIGTLDG